MPVVYLSAVNHLEVRVGGGFVHTHRAEAKGHHEVEASDDDENDDDDDGHGACGQDGLRAERTDHTETPLTGDDGRHDHGHPGESKESNEVVVCDELEQRPVPVVHSRSVSYIDLQLKHKLEIRLDLQSVQLYIRNRNSSLSPILLNTESLLSMNNIEICLTTA